jgi:hypothetical protein
MLDHYKPPIVLVVTHKDLFTDVAPLLKKVLDCGADHGFPITVKEIASFSDNEAVRPGDGIPALLEDLVQYEKSTDANFWTGEKTGVPERQFMNFGKE